MLPAMVLAAGLGTRLRPLTDHRAKPLVPVGDREALGQVVDRLRAAGTARIVVNAHHRRGEVRAFAEREGLAVSVEEALLGTAGGLRHAAALLGDGDVLVWNGDILADLDVSSVPSLARSGAAALLVVAPRALGDGNVGIDASGAIVRLRRETVKGGEVTGGDFLGVHVVGAHLRSALPETGCLVGDVYLPALRGGAVLRALEHAGAWWDIGSIRVYLEANRAWLAARGLSAWVGEGARVAPGVRLVDSVVGERAIVSGAGELRGCVVWPGARATAPAADEVLGPVAAASIQR